MTLRPLFDEPWTYSSNSTRACAEYLKFYLTASEEGKEQVRPASPGGAGRNRTLGVEKLGHIEIPLPPIETQRTVIARIDALTRKTRQVEAHLDAVERDAAHLLALRFRDAIAEAPLRPMAKVAPLVRRTIPGTDFSWQDFIESKPVT